MKSTLVRLSVIALSLTGFAASTVASSAAPKKHEIKPIVIGGNCPPMCLPRDPSHCGMQ